MVQQMRLEGHTTESPKATATASDPLIGLIRRGKRTGFQKKQEAKARIVIRPGEDYDQS